MKQLIALLLSSLFAASVFAADAAPTKNSQQSKMTVCNKEAADKKGDERKAFMKTCLSAKPASNQKPVSAAQQAQRDQMTKCHADAKDMKGDARKAFMKTCLSKK